MEDGVDIYLGRQCVTLRLLKKTNLKPGGLHLSAVSLHPCPETLGKQKEL